MNNTRLLKLQDICSLKTVQSRDDFVGYSFDHETKNCTISFPLGYKNFELPDFDKQYTFEQEKKLKKDILNLIYILRKYGLNNKAQKAKQNSDIEKNQLPIEAYEQLILYYLDNGYYFEKEKLYKLSNKGKINWNKTIKTVTPIMSEHNLIYLTFVTSKIEQNENLIISEIFKYCLHEAYYNFGRIFFNLDIEKPMLKFQYKFFLAILYKKLTNTFNDDLQKLIRAMIDIVKFNGKEHNGNSFYFGTNEFHDIWQNMVNDYFGSKITDELYPVAYFRNTKRKPVKLLPDTIMYPIDQNKEAIYILDEKYYKGALEEDNDNVPRADSLSKQLDYGENAAYFFPNKKIYNAYILPTDKEDFVSYYDSLSPCWLNESNKNDEFRHIQYISMNTRALMYKAFGSKTQIQIKLEKLIEENTDISIKTYKQINK